MERGQNRDEGGSDRRAQRNVEEDRGNSMRGRGNVREEVECSMGYES